MPLIHPFGHIISLFSHMKFQLFFPYSFPSRFFIHKSPTFFIFYNFYGLILLHVSYYLRNTVDTVCANVCQQYFAMYINYGCKIFATQVFVIHCRWIFFPIISHLHSPLLSSSSSSIFRLHSILLFVLPSFSLACSSFAAIVCECYFVV